MTGIESVGIVGLGYVGLPLAVAFGAHVPTIGFDLNATKLLAYRQGVDPSGEVSSEEFTAAEFLTLTDDPLVLSKASIVIVVVPTPIDQAKRPDLAPLESACRTVGPCLHPGSIVVFESTVFPGCTEEVCVPILEETSGLPWAGRDRASETKDGFFVGYSPERINPGDETHRLHNIVKVVAGDTETTLKRLASLYGRVVDAGIHRAPSLKVAEAAKVIENTQRDLNIALMNELAMIFNRLDIDTLDVLEAAGTKWNFLPFRPGLVGGHCIGVDPYYLTYKAQSVGFHPSAVLAGRRINDGVGKFVAEQVVKGLAARNRPITGCPVTMLGLTFKEDCRDLRNSRVPEVVSELREFGCIVSVCDPIADRDEAMKEYGIEIVDKSQLAPAEVVVLAVPHELFRGMPIANYRALLTDGGLIVDVKSALERQSVAKAGLELWRL